MPICSSRKSYRKGYVIKRGSAKNSRVKGQCVKKRSSAKRSSKRSSKKTSKKSSKKSKKHSHLEGYFSLSGGLKATVWKNRYGQITNIQLDFILTEWNVGED